MTGESTAGRGAAGTAPRAAIVTVDDDPAVSRAVARDLRRQYGERHRIVRAESGQAGLEALREMKLRGDPVAVILADYRMPQMNGIEFLEQAMDVFPGARRALLTAYADTGAAIDAINVVDLDYYLLKPWDPPEEKLYPVVDSLLEAERAAAAARRLDDAFRAYLAERGPKAPTLADVAGLVTGASGLRLAADAVLGLWERDAGRGPGEQAVARGEMLAGLARVAGGAQNS
ncbi:MAG: response regulator, partial [Streptosporangiaceae bacterium]